MYPQQLCILSFSSKFLEGEEAESGVAFFLAGSPCVHYRFSVLQAMESWAGPGNEAKIWHGLNARLGVH